MDVIERIAELIRQDPSITVQEIARRLGYSEEKSVYYWLEKARYAGIKDFRKAVLTGEYPPQALGYRPVQDWDRRDHDDQAREKPVSPLHFLANLPVVTGFGPHGEPHAGYVPVPDRYLREPSGQAFLFLLRTDEYLPFLAADDLLLVDPAATPARGDLALIWITDGGIAVYRLYGHSPSPLFTHPVHGRPLATDRPGAQVRVVGKVTHLFRSL